MKAVVDLKEAVTLRVLAVLTCVLYSALVKTNGNITAAMVTLQRQSPSAFWLCLPVSQTLLLVKQWLTLKRQSSSAFWLFCCCCPRTYSWKLWLTLKRYSPSAFGCVTCVLDCINEIKAAVDRKAVPTLCSFTRPRLKCVNKCWPYNHSQWLQWRWTRFSTVEHDSFQHDM